MFESKVDMRSRKEMTNFLLNHFRYDTMNSWNRATSYANNVKLYNLKIPKELEDKAWDLICGDVDTSELQFDIHYCIEEFREMTGYDAGFNGRSGGYIVMYDTDWDYSGEKPVLRTYPGRSIDDYDEEDFAEYDMDWLRERVKLVQRFDEMCNNIFKTFMYYLENFDVVEEEYTVTKTRRVLQEV